jgi:spore germination protein KC
MCIAVSLLVFSIMASGCWDRVEIQDKAIVKAIAIDLAPQPLSSTDKTATFVQPHGEKKYQISFQIIKPGGGKDKNGSHKTTTYVISDTGESLFEASQDALGQTSKLLYYEDLDSIIISEAVLEKIPLKALMDYFIRDEEFRWRVRVYVTPGKAKDILEFKPATEESSGLFMTGIANNQVQNAHLPVGKTDLGYMAETFVNNGDLALPRVLLADHVLKVDGAAIFKKDRFAGYMNDYAVQGQRLIHNLQKSGALVAEYPSGSGRLITLRLTKEHATVTPKLDNGRLYFTVNIAIKGDVDAYNSAAQHLNDKKIPEMETAFQDEVRNCAYYAIRSLQAFPCDPEGYYARKVQAYLPDLWAKIKNNWPAVYAKTPFAINVSVTIKNLGEHR